jgi:Neuraminidase (sialidase)
VKYPCSNPLRITFYALLPALLLAQAGWGPDVRLTYFWGYSYDPRAVCCGDTIHMVWWESYAHEEVFYKRSTDAGVTWEADVMLSVEDDDASVQPTIGVNGNFVHTVWKDEHTGVCYRKSTDGGNTWLQIDTLPDAGLIEPWIHVDGDLLYVLAGGGVAHQIFTKSTDNGITWQMGQIVVHSCGHPRIKKVDSLMLIISHQDNPGAIEIYCLRSTDDGQTWCDTTCVSQYDSVSGQGPAMDTDGSGGIHVCWFDYKYSPYPWTGDILYRASADSGNTWVDIDSLTVSHRAVLSDILVENNNLHLVWEDDRFDFKGRPGDRRKG